MSSYGINLPSLSDDKIPFPVPVYYDYFNGALFNFPVRGEEISSMEERGYALGDIMISNPLAPQITGFVGDDDAEHTIECMSNLVASINAYNKSKNHPIPSPDAMWFPRIE